MAWFKDNPSLVAWANQFPLAAIVDCLGDGHDGVWSLCWASLNLQEVGT